MSGQNDMDDYLEHFGVKGMRWGRRKEDVPGVPNRTSKTAQQDAKEFARAQMFYGQGAGTRRKLIKNTVEARKKQDPLYAKAFDHHVSNQDMSVHAQKAQKERHSKDRRQTAKQASGHVARRLTGEMGTTAAFTAAAIAGGTYLASPSGKRLRGKVSAEAKIWLRTQKGKRTIRQVENFLKKQ